MSEHQITVAGGSSVRLPTAGKYCDRDIVVTAEGGGVDLPALDNPAAEEDVLVDKEFIGGDGERRYGTLQPYAFTPGWEVMVPLEKTYDSSDVFLQMTSLSGFGNATEEDVAAGKIFTNEQGVAKVGTAQAGGGLETVNVTFTIYGTGTIYYMGADGIAMLTSPYEETVAVVKNSPVIIWYENPEGTYLIGRGFNGGTYIMGNAGSHNGSSCDILTFREDGNALYEEV